MSSKSIPKIFETCRPRTDVLRVGEEPATASQHSEVLAFRADDGRLPWWQPLPDVSGEQFRGSRTVSAATLAVDDPSFGVLMTSALRHKHRLSLLVPGRVQLSQI